MAFRGCPHCVGLSAADAVGSGYPLLWACRGTRKGMPLQAHTAAIPHPGQSFSKGHGGKNEGAECQSFDKPLYNSVVGLVIAVVALYLYGSRLSS